MAKKTNKTDHVLNLLSSGKKNSKEDNDAPPVDLRKKVPEPDSDDPFETHLPEPKMTTQEEEPELPEPRMSSREEASELPEPRVSENAPPEERPAVVTIAASAPSVSVVHASNGEDSIAEAVKDSLEAEFSEYLKEKEELEEKLDEKLEEIAAQQEQVIEWQPLKTKEPAEINVFELLGRDEEPEGDEQEENPEPVAEPEPIPETPEPVLEPVSAAEVVQTAGTEPPEEAEDIEMTEPAEESEPTVDPEPIQVPPEVTTAPDEIEEAEPIQDVQEIVQQKEEPMQQDKSEEKDYVTVNVMEHLVRDQVPKYIRQFGHCDCDRCIEDTVALTLTHLPSKYVVVNKNAVSPLLNFYEKKYAGQLIVEITKATMIVNESPHH